MAKKAQSSSISPEFVLLGLLNQKPAHGYDLHEHITHQLGQIWRISLSQTYNILNRLEAQGYIAGVLQEQEKSPARHLFRLTPAGHHRFEIWLNEPTEASARAIRVEFLTRLYFAYTTHPDKAGQLIDAQIADTQAGLSRLQATLANLPQDQVFNRLGLELRIHQLMSLLVWLSGCRLRLAPPQPDTPEANNAKSSGSSVRTRPSKKRGSRSTSP
jgi:DNA-binding PadR family transcriptional regulator